MAEIKNIETLQAEIARLRSEVKIKEQNMRDQVSGFRESLRPANLLFSFIKDIIGDPVERPGKNFLGQAVRKGLLSLAGKILFKEKEKEPAADIFSQAFERIKSFIGQLRKKRTGNKFYKFEDEYDSESN